MEGGRKRRSSTDATTASAFLHYMESGLWYVFVYNDNDSPQKVSFLGDVYDQVDTSCPNDCSGQGECVNDQCECYTGHTGWDCSQSVCPILCQGNGIYSRGRCQCYEGWKGSECSVPRHQCEDPLCSGNGKCVDGTCVCAKGFMGDICADVDCLTPDCHGNGLCYAGICHCFCGYHGSDCSLAMPVLPDGQVPCVRDCSKRGTFDFRTQSCVCEMGWYGPDCVVELCAEDCVNGFCENQRCVCDAGWKGSACDQVDCDPRCVEERGFCHNGTCVCKPGWNGQYCSLDGCPNDCHNNGACLLFHDRWRCSCKEGWKGKECRIAMETECEDGLDGDNDGLPDCQDPDCCMSISCKDSLHCLTSPDPMEILLRKQPPSSTASFYDRMRFLIEDDSVQSYPTASVFDASQVSVIRGMVLGVDGSPLIGVRVSVVTQPLYGFTLTREMGLFDILVNGGGSVTIQFQRQPFAIKQRTVMVPWNRMITMDTVALNLEGESPPEEMPCPLVEHDHYNIRPVVLSTWQHTQLGACPDRSTVIPESQVLQESLHIPDTDVYLVYHSSETPGYMSTILIQLTPEEVPVELRIVHLRVIVEGLVFERIFEADHGLKYKFAWDRRNAYNQKVYGIVTASVAVGYQYAECEHIFWEVQSATMSGYDITSSEIGGWNLHIHHTYNYQEGILHKGDGTNIYLKERPRKVETVLGNGRQRRLDCRQCDGPSKESRLLAPVALASGRDGSLYVGDYNYIRKLSANKREVVNILKLQMPEVPYKYFMTVSPLNGKLYISDFKSRRIIRVKTMGSVRELENNAEYIAGTGEQCFPGDPQKCGDGQQASSAKLIYPKGIAINKDGLVYFADAANIRTISPDNIISTLIGHQGQPTHWNPLPCESMLSAEEITLHWPTALAISPLDDTLHILDNNLVLKVTANRQVLVVAGRPLHCPPKNPNISSLLTEEQAGPKLATDELLHSPQHIAFAPNGDLYITESDGKFVNQIRVVNTDGTIAFYAGAKSKCNCQEEGCKCFNSKEELATKMLLNNPTAITVTPDNVLHVADMGNLRIHSIVATLPISHQYGQYEVLYPQTQESYLFNRYGQHIATKNIITDQFVYNFTYSVNSYYGRLVKVVDTNSNQLVISRDYSTQAKEIVVPAGSRCKLKMDNMGQLYQFITGDNSSTSFTYFSNTGLLQTKETTEGWTFIYDYDENGRLATIVQPTGEMTAIGTDISAEGALVVLNTHGAHKASMATNGNHTMATNMLLFLTTDDAERKVSYLNDGSLVVEYPFKMAITLETNPHPLLSTEHQLQVKRKVILPDNLIHRLEWRYFLRRDGKTRRSKTIGRVGRRMRVNGQNLLTFEYDRDDHSESILNSESEEILLIDYNQAGQLTQVVATGNVEGINITYDSHGHMTSWTRGNLGEKFVYDDKSGMMIEKRLPNRAAYRYIYKTGNKPTDVILPSGKQYLFHYDHHGNLRAITMPNLARHQFHSLTSLHLHRLMYRPPSSHGVYIQDYNSIGQLIQVLYPSNHRRMVYAYTLLGQPKSVLFDWTEVTYAYYPKSQVLHSVNISSFVSYNYNCSLVFLSGEALVAEHAVLFDGSDMDLMSARFHYAYDQNFKVASFEAYVANEAFRAYNLTYDPKSGRLTRMKDFNFEYPKIHKEILRDSNVQIIREFDNYGRNTDVWFKFNNHVVFNLEVKFDSLNRIHQWRRKIGSSDLKSYEYVYDIDGNLAEVLMSGQSTWRYEHDANSNIVKISHHSNVKTIVMNNKNQVESSKDKSYIFDQDGFLARKDNEMFEYNSRGQLVRAFENGKYDIHYFYDGYARLMARKDRIQGFLTQYFYGDLQHKNRITHIYEKEHTDDDKVTVLYYDNHDKLFAMQQNGNVYYIALDPVGSPVLILNAMGGVVKQITYDPLGNQVEDSAPDFHFRLGFQCGIVDYITKMIFFGDKLYEPGIGRYTAPRYEDLMKEAETMTQLPERTNLYRNPSLVNVHLDQHASMTDVPFWLSKMGYDMDILLPKVNFEGQIHSSAVANDLQMISTTSAFECAFYRDMNNFVDISIVPRSKVAPQGQTKDTSRSFSPFEYIFGSGVVLSSVDGRVVVNVLDTVNERLAMLATTLLNSSYAIDLHFTKHSKDYHFFVKESLEAAADNLRDLALRPENTLDGLNISVHRHRDSPTVMKYIDVKIHSNHSVLNLRYGTTVAHERSRILSHARERAIELAWAVERELVQSNKRTVNEWTRQESAELLSQGRVTGVHAEYIRDIRSHPELADDPKNIRFVPGTR
ncbi:hypothetical protein CAPTEDRAFT_159800 [Capitella teleta]|uniref:EGF-like domain-containing protein n=1 Tax=Capitella teleta TaxID=283909 RepID=R7UQU7_CAPTE|nr:hypothetical protein CAPTEDRAFT_159800 [Capitella teleta]|eukprot:ELU08904.1 hypothetical protein CAPTEDRAFT_159800 [Capitella teleta]